MARARNIKPGFFKNEVLGVADPLYSLLFEGLWVLADRAGRLEDRPLRIKGEVFPYREGIDIEAMLTWLQANDFIVRYQVAGKRYILVTEFVKHQNPHKNEAESVIPAPEPESATSYVDGATSEEIGKPSEEIGTTRADPGFLIPDSGYLDSGYLDSVPNGTGADAPLPEAREVLTVRDQVFAVGISLLTAAGVSDKNARSFLAAQCKAAKDESVVLAALQACARESPIQPVPWLVAKLGNGKAQAGSKHTGFALKNYRDGVEADGSFS